MGSRKKRCLILNWKVSRTALISGPTLRSKAISWTARKAGAGRASCVTRTATRSIIKRGSDGHYVYFSVREDNDNGSIIDFVQNRQRLSLGAVRKELRPWIGMPASQLPAFPPLAENLQGPDAGRNRIRQNAGRSAPSLS